MGKKAYWSSIYRITLLISKSKSQQLTADERAVLQEWLDSDPKNVERYNRLSADADSAKLEDMLSRDPESHYHHIISQGKSRSKVNRLLRYGVWAAAALLLIAFLFPDESTFQGSVVDTGNVASNSSDEVVLQSPSGSENIIVQADSVYEIATLVNQSEQQSMDEPTAEEWVTIRTPVGKTIAFTLEDGSTVYLNSKSTTTFDKSPNFKNNRKIILDGEAYFEVAEDHAHPFVVDNNGKEIKVLGTAFNIKGYREQDKFKLGLAHGKVELRMKDQGYTGVLTPGHEVTYNKNTHEISRETDKNIYDIGSWRQGVYIFEQVSLEELTRDLQLIYPITFKYEEELPKYRFSGEISRTEKWQKVLEKLEMTNRVRFTVDGNEVTVRDVPHNIE